METVERRKRRDRRSYTPEFKSEIVARCRSGDRSVPEAARDFDLTESAVRRWVAQAVIDAGERQGLTTEEREKLRRSSQHHPSAGGVRWRWFRDATTGSLTDQRSQVLSPVDGPHVPGNRQISQISRSTSTASSEQGDDLAAPRAHHRSIRDQ